MAGGVCVGGFYLKDEEFEEEESTVYIFYLWVIRYTMLMMWRLVVQVLALAHEAPARREGTMVN